MTKITVKRRGNEFWVIFDGPTTGGVIVSRQRWRHPSNERDAKVRALLSARDARRLLVAAGVDVEIIDEEGMRS